MYVKGSDIVMQVRLEKLSCLAEVRKSVRMRDKTFGEHRSAHYFSCAQKLAAAERFLMEHMDEAGEYEVILS